MAFKMINCTYIELSSLLMRCKHTIFRELNQSVDTLQILLLADFTHFEQTSFSAKSGLEKQDFLS